MASPKPLPEWVEPVLIAMLAVGATVQWYRGDSCWALFFAGAALAFGVTRFRRPRV